MYACVVVMSIVRGNHVTCASSMHASWLGRWHMITMSQAYQSCHICVMSHGTIHTTSRQRERERGHERKKERESERARTPSSERASERASKQKQASKQEQACASGVFVCVCTRERERERQRERPERTCVVAVMAPSKQACPHKRRCPGLGFEGFVLLVWACGARIRLQRYEKFVAVFCSQVVAVFCSQVVAVFCSQVL